MIQSTYGRLTRLALAFVVGAGITTLAPAEPPKLARNARPADITHQPTRHIAELLMRGDVDKAAAELANLKQPGDPLAERLATYIERYSALLAERKALHEQELQRAIDEVKERVAEDKWREALVSLRLADELSPTKGELLRQDWVVKLVDSSKDRAAELANDRQWLDAAGIYAQLAAVFDEDDARKKSYEEEFQRLARHARMAETYKVEQRADWQQALSGINRGMVDPVLRRVRKNYVTEPDFRKMAVDAVETLGVLARTESVYDTFEGLKAADARQEFIAGVERLLASVKAADNFSLRSFQDTFNELYDVNRRTIDLPEEVITYEFIEGAMAELDPFSSMIWPNEVNEFKSQTEGEFTGVGIQISLNEAKELEVASPLPDTPAYLAGIHAGDVIIKVSTDAGEFAISDITPNMRLTRAVKLIKGPKGTKVTLSVRRPGVDEPIDFELFRDVIRVETVKGFDRNPDNSWNFWLDRDDKIGYVRVTQFSQNTLQVLEDVLRKLQRQNVRGLVLDLRDNPGGLLSAAEEMSDLFISDGTIVSTRGREGRNEYRTTAKPNDVFEDVPLVVLINEFSASASEIVSGAVRDTRRGLVIGERSFGKGSVQNLIGIDNDAAYVKLTTAKYYLPSGRSIHREEDAEEWGVEPDVKLKLSPEETLQVFRMARDKDLVKIHADNTEAVRPEATTQPARRPLPKLSTDPQIELALLVLRSKLLTSMAWPFADPAQAAAPANRTTGTN